jgi:hypothetical protein
LAGLAASVAPAGAAPAETAPAKEGPGPINRVLLLSLPGATWEAVRNTRTPSLDRLLGGSAVGSTSVRAINRDTTPGEGYATVGAGTAVSGVNGLDNLAFQAAEPVEEGTAADAFTRRTGHPATGAVLSLAGPALAADAKHRHRGAEIGALGGALARGGVRRAVVGNADHALSDRRPSTFHREAALALSDGYGVVQEGEVERTLLRPDPSAPFGARLDPDATLDAFRRAWAAPRAVVLVEASDLARAQAFRSLTTEDQWKVTVHRELEATDALVGRILDVVDADHDAVIVLAPSDPGDGVHLTLAALRAPGVRPGLLVSGSTRRPGFVMLTDYAPTILDLLHLERPNSMEGRPFQVRPAQDSAYPPVSQLVEADRNARFHDRMVGPVAGAFVVGQVLLSLIAAITLGRARTPPAVRNGLALAALCLLAVLPLTLFPAVLNVTNPAIYAALVGAAALVVAGGAFRPASRQQDTTRGGLLAVGIILALLFGLLLVDVVTGAHLQLSTVFGYSPTVGGRFAGFGNLAFAELAASGVLLAGIVAHLGGRRGVFVGAALLAAAVVADGMPIWGSDVGGVLAAVPAFAVVVLGLCGIRISRGRAAAVGAAAVAAVLAFGAIDLLRPAPERTHLGRLFERIGADGFGPLSDVIQRKVQENLEVLPSFIWVPVVPAVLVFLAWLAWGSSSRLELVRTRVPELRPVLVGVLVAGVLGFALNDSGIAVPAMMLGVLNPVLVFLALEWS